MTKSSQNNLDHYSAEDEIDLKEMFRVLMNAKKIIIQVTIVFALCSVIYSLLLTNYYKSEALLSVSNTDNQALSLSGRSMGLASLVGLSLPTSGAINKSDLVIATVQSRAFLKHLIKIDGDLLPSMMAAKRFDQDTNTLIINDDLYDSNKKLWLSAKPTALKAHDNYKSQVSISQNAKTGLISISVEHISPIFAKDFLDLIIKEVNSLLRQKDLEESANALEYLTSEASKTQLITMKEAINGLIQSQLETQMMAKISSEYVLQIIEPPYVPERKSKPSRSLISIVGTALGCFLGIFWVLIRHYSFTEEG